MKTLKFNSLLLAVAVLASTVLSVSAAVTLEDKKTAIRGYYASQGIKELPANIKLELEAKVETSWITESYAFVAKQAPQAVVKNEAPKAAQKAEGESWYDYVAKKAAYVRDNKMEAATTAAKYAAAAVLASATLYGANKGLEALGAYDKIANAEMVKSVMSNSAVNYVATSWPVTGSLWAAGKALAAAQYPGSQVCGLLASGYNMASGYLTSAPAVTPAVTAPAVEVAKEVASVATPVADVVVTGLAGNQQ